jgi:hypothetical protein
VSRDSSKKKSERNLDKISSAISNTLSNDLAGALGESAKKPVRPEPVEGQSDDASSEASPAFPPGATMCNKCNTNAVIMMDGCATCLNCGYSKCG